MIFATTTSPSQKATTKMTRVVVVTVTTLLLMLMMTSMNVNNNGVSSLLFVNAQVDIERSICDFCDEGLSALFENVIVSQSQNDGVDLMVTCKDIFIFNLAEGYVITI